MHLNQLTLLTRNIPAAVAFYQTLGLQLIVLAVHYARFVCTDGGTSLSVRLNENLESFAPSSTMVYFECDNLDMAVASLKAREVLLESEPADMLWREARLRDVDGNPLCLYFAGENRLNPPWRVKENES